MKQTNSVLSTTIQLSISKREISWLSMNVSVLLQRSSWNTICLPCLLISRWNISKVRRFFNLSDYQLLPTTASPAEQIAVSGIKRSVFDEWCQISLFRPKMHLCKRETNEEIGKFSNHWMATMIFESKENGALLFAYLSFDMISHKMIGRI